jgi:protein O-mannosyl-transferase
LKLNPGRKSSESHESQTARTGMAPGNTGRPAETRLISRAQMTGLVGAVLFLAAGWVFFSALSNDFVQWDDDISITQNPHIQGLDWPRVRWMFTDVGQALRYKPLSWLTYALIYSANGLNPFGYHFVGLCFHGLNAVLLFLVLRRLLEAGFGARWNFVSVAAGIGAGLWAVHPLRVEPVVWATDINYGQALFFTLISLWCYLRAIWPTNGAKNTRAWLVGAVAAFALGMLTYPVVFGFVAVLVVLDFYPLRRFNRGQDWWRDATARRLWLEKAPFALVASLLFISLFSRLKPTGIWTALPVEAHFSLFGRVMQAFYVWDYYVWKPLVPFNLSPVYTTLIDFDPKTWPFVLSAVAVIGVTLLFVWKRREWPLALALWICHLVLTLPGLGLTEHPHYTNDRYGHIPGLLWAVLVAAGCVKLWQWRHRAGAMAAGGLAVLAVVCGIMSARQTLVWHDSASLFQHMIAGLGNTPYRVEIYFRLGRYQLQQKEPDQAAASFGEAIRINPRDARSLNARAGARTMMGEHRLALADYQSLIRLNPADPTGYIQTAWILTYSPEATIRNGKSAVEAATKACELAQWKDPHFVAILAGAYAEAGDFNQAVKYQRQALMMAGVTGSEHDELLHWLSRYEQHLPIHEPGK